MVAAGISPSRGAHESGLTYADDSPFGDLVEQIGAIAASGASVVFWGERGSGRRSLAGILHHVSESGSRPLRRFKATRSSTESELDLTVATARGSSLLIEEVSRLASALQERLADFLDGPEANDIRLITTCPDEPGALVASEELNEELYYRIGVFTIRVPPLRERPEDVRPLARQFIDAANRRHGLAVDGISEEALDHLAAADWPGNVPDFRRTIDHAAIRAAAGPILLDHLPTEYLEGKRQPRPVVLDPGTSLAEAERRLILATLEQTGQNKAEAARRLGLDVKTVRNKLRSYGLM